MSLITRMRRQVATWFQQTGTDEFGQPSFTAGVEIKCRWSDEAKEVIAPDGSKMISSSVVYVDRDMEPGDLLQNSPLSDSDVEEASRIEAFQKIPNLKATEYLRVAYL